MVVASPEENNAAAAIAGGGGEEDAVAEGLQAIAVDGNEDEEEVVKWLGHYSSVQSILLVGDGDLSFSVALATSFGSGANLVATSLDSYVSLMSKYSRAMSNLAVLKRMAATILHGVDAKTMKLHTDLKMRRFDRIVFNFPYAGFKGREDNVHVINLHKGLVRDFFRNASHLLRPCGEVHVSHKTGHPYEKWDLEQLASESSLVLVECIEFHKEVYPGYNNKRGDGQKCDRPFKLGDCRTFKFRIGDLKKLKRVHWNRLGSISSVRCSKAHLNMLATGGRPFFLPAVVPPVPETHVPPPAHMVNMPTAPVSYHLDIVQRRQFSAPIDMNCIPTAPDFHQHGTIQPIHNIPSPSVDFSATSVGIPRSFSNITSMSLFTPQHRPWNQRTPLHEPLGSSEQANFAQEYRKSLRREYEMHRNAMPGATSMDYFEYRERCRVHSVQKQEWLGRITAMYGKE